MTTVAKLIKSQSGVATRQQLVKAGLSPARIASRLASGRWQRHGLVIATNNGTPTRDQLQWIAVLNHPQPCGLAGLTAATGWGLTGWDSDAVHVIVRRGTPAWKSDDVVVHESRRFTADDLFIPRNEPPLVTPCRAVIDAAAWEPSPRRAGGLVCASVQQGVCSPMALAEELKTAGAIRHRRLLRSVIGDAVGGAQSFAEIDFTVLARRAGLPPPKRQAIRKVGGRTRYLDVEFDSFVVEVDGAHHFSAASYAKGLDRLNDLVIGGDRVLQFSTLTIRTDPKAVIAKLRAAKAAFPPAA